MNAGKLELTIVLAVAGAILGLPAPAGAATIGVTITSDTVANDGECSLREAVTATNTNADVNGADDCNHDGDTGPDVIVLPDGTLPTLGAAGENANASGDLDVEAGDKLTILGEGAGDTHIDGDLDRVIHLESGKLGLRSLELFDGEAGAGDGGGVLADLTHALRERSKAVNHVPRSQCEDAAGHRLKTDQRAVRRPFGRRCDAGAYERDLLPSIP